MARTSSERRSCDSADGAVLVRYIPSRPFFVCLQVLTAFFVLAVPLTAVIRPSSSPLVTIWGSRMPLSSAGSEDQDSGEHRGCWLAEPHEEKRRLPSQKPGLCDSELQATADFVNACLARERVRLSFRNPLDLHGHENSAQLDPTTELVIALPASSQCEMVVWCFVDGKDVGEEAANGTFLAASRSQG